jgi:rhodanese-related sulfurtransferase
VPTTAADLVAQARSQVHCLTVDEVSAAASCGALLVDVREPRELDVTGMIPGAVHAPRGMLEFWADPAHPHHRQDLDPARRTIVYSASGARSALAAQLLGQLGYADVAHLDVGIEGWIRAGRPLVSPRRA